MNKTEDALERLAKIVDRLESVSAAMNMPGVGPDVHLQSLRPIIPELKAEIRSIYYELGGNNVWSE